MLALYISLEVVGGLLLLFFLALLYIYHGVYYSPLKGQDNDFFLTEGTLRMCDKDEVYKMIQTLRDIPYEDAYITSFDKLKLHARVYKNPSSDKVCIMCHGYRGTPCRDFSGGAMEMINSGYNVILIDERAHGQSEGHTITFGRREQRDCLDWVKYAEETFGEDKQIILVGISMGGASVLLASDRVKEGVKIIADSPYTTEKEIMCETMRNILHMNPNIFFPIANLASIIFGHTNLNKDDAKRNIANSKADILIIHGDGDTIVPHKLSYAAYRQYPDKIRYELFPTADHGISYLIDKERYRRIIKEFIEG